MFLPRNVPFPSLLIQMNLSVFEEYSTCLLGSFTCCVNFSLNYTLHTTCQSFEKLSLNFLWEQEMLILLLGCRTKLQTQVEATLNEKAANEQLENERPLFKTSRAAAIFSAKINCPQINAIICCVILWTLVFVFEHGSLSFLMSGTGSRSPRKPQKRMDT